MRVHVSRTLSFLITLTVVVGPSVASGTIINFVPSSITSTPGESIRVDLVLGDFVPGSSPVLGDFDIRVRFDRTRLASNIESLPTATVFGPTLGIPGTESTAIWGVFEDEAPDVVRIAEIAVLQAAALAELQTASSLYLASLYFDVLTAGESLLEFSSLSFGGAGIFSGTGYHGTGPRLDVTSGTSVRVTSIAEPRSAHLLLIGLVLLVVVRFHVLAGSSKFLAHEYICPANDRKPGTRSVR